MNKQQAIRPTTIILYYQKCDHFFSYLIYITLLPASLDLPLLISNENRHYQQCGAACLLLKIFKGMHEGSIRHLSKILYLNFDLSSPKYTRHYFQLFLCLILCYIITFVSTQVDSQHKFNIPSCEAIDYDFHTMQTSLAMFLPGILLNMSTICACGWL